jgi:2-keto-4-pentenoate hydratase
LLTAQDEHRAAVVQALLQARRQGAPVEALNDLPDAASAYAVQEDVARRLGWFRRPVPRHWKSGGVPANHAFLPARGVRSSPAMFSDLPDRGTVEAEIAMRLRRSVSSEEAATLTTREAWSLIDAVCVAIEVVVSRWVEGQQAPRWCRLADLQSHGGLVIGPWRPTRLWQPADRSKLQGHLHIGDRQVDISASHPLGDPAEVLPAWLRHITRSGMQAHAGTVVTTGAWAGMHEARRGELVIASLDNLSPAQMRW